MRRAVLKRMAEKNSLQHTAAELSADANSKSWLNAWRQCLRWSPTSKEDTVQSEKRLLTSLVNLYYRPLNLTDSEEVNPVSRKKCQSESM